MFQNQKKLSFAMALYEYEETIPSLFDTVTKYAADHAAIVQPTTNEKSLWHFIIDPETNGYNRCHFWSNFQVMLSPLQTPLNALCFRLSLCCRLPI